MTIVHTSNSVSNEHKAAKERLDAFLENWSMDLKQLDRQDLEHSAIESCSKQCSSQSLDTKCVNYLRHQCSSYDALVDVLSRPVGWMDSKCGRHVLHVERRRCVATAKEKILDQIAESYPWLADECARQKERSGVGEDPGDYMLRFGPFRGCMLRDVEPDYLIRLLGQKIGASLRNRIERLLAEKVMREFVLAD